jgi:hypothetical protein
MCCVKNTSREENEMGGQLNRMQKLQNKQGERQETLLGS